MLESPGGEKLELEQGKVVVAMLYYTLACCMVVTVAGLLGFSVLTGTVAWIAKTLFYIFITTLLLSLVADLGPPSTKHPQA